MCRPGTRRGLYYVLYYVLVGAMSGSCWAIYSQRLWGEVLVDFAPRLDSVRFLKIFASQGYWISVYILPADTVEDSSVWVFG